MVGCFSGLEIHRSYPKKSLKPKKQLKQVQEGLLENSPCHSLEGEKKQFDGRMQTPHLTAMLLSVIL